MKLFNQDINNYQALVFDFDGTLVDSMPHHNKAWKEAFLESGFEMPQELLDETTGMASKRIVSIVNDRFKKNFDPSLISKIKRKKYLQNLEHVQLVRPVFEIVKNFYKKCPLGIITGSSHAVVDQLLLKLGIEKYFDSIICADDTEKGKDSTEPYELFASQQNVLLENCLFFDDGDVGLKGAKLSGMSVVHIDINHPDIFLSLK